MELSWRSYHEATKHTPERLRQSAHTLDWANMPNPFRHYEGVPVHDLPADPPPGDISAWDVLRGCLGTTAPRPGAEVLSQLFFYSAAVSATKLAPATGSRYALRVNPSSGNLHPTEFHFATWGLAGWPDGLYHYRPSQHMAERRGTGDFGFAAPVAVILTSIASREAWKYRDRAYRYCLLDIGHAWQCLELAARAAGFFCTVTGAFNDSAIAARLALPDDEWPMLIIELHRDSLRRSSRREALPVLSGGTPNQLSAAPVVPESIRRIHTATSGVSAPWPLPRTASAPPALGGRGFGETVRARRSALDFVGGEHAMSLPQLLALLSIAAAKWIVIYVYVHRVSGLAAGLYRYDGDLELLRAGDQRVVAAGLSLGQDLAGNACIAISMAADLASATAVYGGRAYRFAHFEAGALGQRLYVGATALGLAATGIGAFFDDGAHAYLGIKREQVLYHFAIGYPVPDSRLKA
jgi:SagB-type dehydrogenase family enzyme